MYTRELQSDFGWFGLGSFCWSGGPGLDAPALRSLDLIAFGLVSDLQFSHFGNHKRLRPVFRLAGSGFAFAEPVESAFRRSGHSCEGSLFRPVWLGSPDFRFPKIRASLLRLCIQESCNPFLARLVWVRFAGAEGLGSMPRHFAARIRLCSDWFWICSFRSSEIPRVLRKILYLNTLLSKLAQNRD